MVPFKKYLGEMHSPDWIDSDATVLSQTGLEKLLFERPNLEYCFVVPRNLNSSKDNQKIRSYFQENRMMLYPVAATNKREHGRVYVVTKKPHTRSQDFRESISDAFYQLQNFDAIYTNGNTIRTLDKNGTHSINEQPSITVFQQLIGNTFGKKMTLHGVEVPINEDIEYFFRTNNLIVLPLTSHDRQYSKNWNDFLND